MIAGGSKCFKCGSASDRPANDLLPTCWRLGRIMLENGSLWDNNAGESDFLLKHHQ